MPGPLSLSFGITADPSDADAALKLLQKDMAAVSAETAKVGRSLGLLPSQTADVVKQFNALATAEERAAFAVREFGDAGLKAIPTLERLRTQSEELAQRQQQLAQAVKKTDDALQNIARQGLSALTQNLGPAANLLDDFAVSMGKAGFAAVAVAAAIVGSVKAWADLGGKIQDASLETGLSAETLTSMRVAAATGGVSIDELSAAFVRMQRTAVEGSDEARKALALFGLTPRQVTEDFRGSLDKLIKNFHELGPSAARTAALMEIFGRGAARLIPFLEDAEGGLAAMEKQARKAGAYMTTEGVKAADDFADAWEKTKLELEGVAVTTAQKTLPALNKFDAFIRQALLPSQKFAENLERMNAAQKAAAQLAGQVALPAPKLRLPPGVTTEDFERQRDLAFESARAQAEEAEKLRKEAARKAEAAAKKAENERKRRAEEEARNQVALEKAKIAQRLQAAETGYEQEKALLEASLKDELITVERFTARMIDQEVKLGRAREKASEEARAVDIRAATATTAKLTAATEAATRQAKIRADVLKETKQLEAEAPRLLAKQSEELSKQTKELERNAESAQKAREQWAKLVEQQFLRTAEEGQEPITAVAPFSEMQLQLAAQMTAVQGLARVWGELRAAITASASVLRDDWAESAGLVFKEGTKDLDLFASIAKAGFITLNDFVTEFGRGIGQLVEQYVLLGTTGPAALKKVLAATLATVAAEAAVRAVYATAYGFLMLAMQQYAQAGQAFIAAGVWAGIAVGTGLAGRAIAGSTQQGGEAFGGEAAPPGDVYIGGSGASIGRRREELLMETLDANTAVMSRLGSAPAGEVAVWMGEQAPVVFTNAAAEGAARDSGAGRLLLANAGVGN